MPSIGYSTHCACLEKEGLDAEAPKSEAYDEQLMSFLDTKNIPMLKLREPITLEYIKRKRHLITLFLEYRRWA